VTRNHYLHEFYPHLHPYHRCDDEPEPAATPRSLPRPPGPKLKSRQAPRTVRLEREASERKHKEAGEGDTRPALALLPEHRPQQNVVASKSVRAPVPAQTASLPTVLRATHPAAVAAFTSQPQPPARVVCHARTRVPTPHGDVWIHLYKNNRDAKEHLAFVVDKHQLAFDPSSGAAPSPHFIRSKSLDAVWHPNETAHERLVRGAYMGRLSPDNAVPSPPSPPASSPASQPSEELTGAATPLVRIHSECFTGETIGSRRCDCGEQLDEAFRLIASDKLGRGIIIYLRQEGRGIGLLEKLRAYNLQDLGHDTVTANLMLGHGADMRSYEMAGAMLRDLGVEDGVRLLTNNPDKIEQVEREAIRVVERVPMVPRSWRKAREASSKSKSSSRPSLLRKAVLGGGGSRRRTRQPRRMSDGDGEAEDEGEDGEEEDDDDSTMTEEDEEARSDAEHAERFAGVGMIGAGATESTELDKYLRTKIEKMGHMLDLADVPHDQPPPPPSSSSSRARKMETRSSSTPPAVAMTNGTRPPRPSMSPSPLTRSWTSAATATTDEDEELRTDPGSFYLCLSPPPSFQSSDDVHVRAESLDECDASCDCFVRAPAGDEDSAPLYPYGG
jgi:GTP cyclohydrolase II